MKISSRARYAARAVYYLSLEYGNGAIALHNISDEQDISIKYLENIMRLLTTAGVVKSEKGKNGGFALTRPPVDITMNDVVEATEGRFLPVLCLRDADMCKRVAVCAVRDTWGSLGKVVTDHLKSISFQDIIDKQKKKKSDGALEKEDWNYY